MKRIILTIFIIFFILTELGIVASSNNLSKEKTTVQFSQLQINEENGYSVIELQGTNTQLMRYNHYILPTRLETFSFPVGTQIKNINCIPRNIQHKKICKELPVAPEPVMLTHDIIEVNKKTESTPITSTAWFTVNIGTGILNNQRSKIVKIQLFPVQYHPLEHTIEWAEEIDIEITYIEPQEPILSVDEYEFLILSPAPYVEELEELVDHKNNRGLNTLLVTLDDIYESQYFPVEGRDNPEKIKYFIKHAMETWGIKSVLLVGGAEAFPIRQTHVYVEYFDVDEPYVSDLYYADIYNADGSFEWIGGHHRDSG